MRVPSAHGSAWGAAPLTLLLEILFVSVASCPLGTHSMFRTLRRLIDEPEKGCDRTMLALSSEEAGSDKEAPFEHVSVGGEKPTHPTLVKAGAGERDSGMVVAAALKDRGDAGNQ
jgi:hypothetical protein